MMVKYWHDHVKGKDKVASLMLREGCCAGCKACYLML